MGGLRGDCPARMITALPQVKVFVLGMRPMPARAGQDGVCLNPGCGEPGGRAVCGERRHMGVGVLLKFWTRGHHRLGVVLAGVFVWSLVAIGSASGAEPSFIDPTATI